MPQFSEIFAETQGDFLTFKFFESAGKVSGGAVVGATVLQSAACCRSRESHRVGEATSGKEQETKGVERRLCVRIGNQI